LTPETIVEKVEKIRHKPHSSSVIKTTKVKLPAKVMKRPNNLIIPFSSNKVKPLRSSRNKHDHAISKTFVGSTTNNGARSVKA